LELLSAARELEASALLRLDATTAELCTEELCSAELCTAELCTAELCAAEDSKPPRLELAALDETGLATELLLGAEARLAADELLAEALLSTALLTALLSTTLLNAALLSNATLAADDDTTDDSAAEDDAEPIGLGAVAPPEPPQAANKLQLKLRITRLRFIAYSQDGIELGDRNGALIVINHCQAHKRKQRENRKYIPKKRRFILIIKLQPVTYYA
jgi:hypothetical protein